MAKWKSAWMTHTLAERFWEKVQKQDSCWLWMGAKTRGGYGHLHRNYQDYPAHRLSWVLAHGEIPKGLCVLHQCDVRACVNPSHLFLGTKKDNTADMDRKGRRVAVAPPPRYGDTNPVAKLTREQVLNMRERYAAGVSFEKLAAQFEVHRMTSYRVVTGRTWAPSEFWPKDARGKVKA